MSNQPGTAVIVDDAAVRSALKLGLEAKGFRARLSRRPKVPLADGDLPCCGCLLDYRMPLMDGLQLIGALRKRHVAMPAILIAGHANDGLRCLATR